MRICVTCHAIGATKVGQTMLERFGFKEVVSLEEEARKGYVLLPD